MSTILCPTDVLHGSGITIYAPWWKEDFDTHQQHLFYPPGKGNVFWILWDGRFITHDGRIV